MSIEKENLILHEDTAWGIYISRYHGSVSINNLLDHIEMCRSWDTQGEVKILIDYRDAFFENITLNCISKLTIAVQSEVESFKNVRMAFIHSKPQDQVLSELFKVRSKHITGFQCEVFTTEEGAVCWLGKLYATKPGTDSDSRITIL